MEIVVICMPVPTKGAFFISKLGLIPTISIFESFRRRFPATKCPLASTFPIVIG